jgi:hypothetical protein
MLSETGVPNEIRSDPDCADPDYGPSLSLSQPDQRPNDLGDQEHDKDPENCANEHAP